MGSQFDLVKLGVSALGATNLAKCQAVMPLGTADLDFKEDFGEVDRRRDQCGRPLAREPTELPGAHRSGRTHGRGGLDRAHGHGLQAPGTPG